MNPIQDILIAINRIREEVISKRKTFGSCVFQHNDKKYTLCYNKHEERISYYHSLICIDDEDSESMINLYPTYKDEIFINYGSTFGAIPFRIYDLEEESKKDDVELILTHGKELLFLKENETEIMQGINLAFELLGRIK